jgi:hypothetical protein
MNFLHDAMCNLRFRSSTYPAALCSMLNRWHMLSAMTSRGGTSRMLGLSFAVATTVLGGIKYAERSSLQKIAVSAEAARKQDLALTPSQITDLKVWSDLAAAQAPTATLDDERQAHVQGAANGVAIEASPMPMRNTLIIPSRLHLSASQPAGSENSSKALLGKNTRSVLKSVNRALGVGESATAD